MIAPEHRLRDTFLRIALATGLLLLVPLLAMQVTEQVDWSAGDFVAMGILSFTGGSALALVARKATRRRHRMIIGGLVVAAVVYAWAELAVGVFTTLGS